MDNGHQTPILTSRRDLPAAGPPRTLNCVGPMRIYNIDRLQAEYGFEAWTNPEQQRRTMRGFKTAQGKLGRKLWDAWEQVQRVEKRRAAIPKRVPVQSVTDKPVVKLAPERKHLSNVIKMLAYQSESDLLRLAALITAEPTTKAGH
jgi:hypothetical protein